ncbi:TPA: hypothetical protein TXJ10_002025, partial [Streptococcus suis]|nr:hypothetical protein [Streptococcus suis]HEL1978257.1 hypothetical protein [Streptococcus suis]
SHTNPCHIADFYEKRKRQSQTTSTKPHTIASIHRLIRTMYYLIMHNKLYDYASTQNRKNCLCSIIVTPYQKIST